MFGVLLYDLSIETHRETLIIASHDQMVRHNAFRERENHVLRGIGLQIILFDNPSEPGLGLLQILHENLKFLVIFYYLHRLLLCLAPKLNDLLVHIRIRACDADLSDKHRFHKFHLVFKDTLVSLVAHVTVKQQAHFS